jgi:hypothetical protein
MLGGAKGYTTRQNNREDAMIKSLAVSVIGLICSAFFVMSAVAQQGYIVQNPGQPNTYINPRPGGGYVVQTPGQPNTYINPRSGGGYEVQTPGQPNTYINPQPPALTRHPCIQMASGPVCL